MSEDVGATDVETAIIPTPDQTGAEMTNGAPKKVPVENDSKEQPVASELEKKIIRQVEYYFGDINLGRDNFLKEQTKKDDGWVPLSVLITFNRLKSLSTDFEVIAGALRKSTANVLEVSEDGLKVRRSPTLPHVEAGKDYKEKMKQKTVYVKGFPLDTTLDDLLEFFSSVGNTNNIQMRRDAQRKFKGSVFVAFTSVKDAKAFLTDTDVMYKESPLLKEFQDDYWKRKNVEKDQRKKEQGEKRDTAIKNRSEGGKKLEMTKDSLVHIANIPPETTREHLKDFFNKHQRVAWVDFNQGDKEGKLRFYDEGIATPLVEKLTAGQDGKLIFRDVEVTIRALAGEEEVKHWQDMWQFQKDRRGDKQQNKRHHEGGRGRGRGGRGGWRGSKTRRGTRAGKVRKLPEPGGGSRQSSEEGSDDSDGGENSDGEGADTIGDRAETKRASASAELESDEPPLKIFKSA